MSSTLSFADEEDEEEEDDTVKKKPKLGKCAAAAHSLCPPSTLS